MVQDYINDLRFKDLKPLKENVWLASPTMHGKELDFMTEAY